MLHLASLGLAASSEKPINYLFFCLSKVCIISLLYNYVYGLIFVFLYF